MCRVSFITTKTFSPSFDSSSTTLRNSSTFHNNLVYYLIWASSKWCAHRSDLTTDLNDLDEDNCTARCFAPRATPSLTFYPFKLSYTTFPHRTFIQLPCTKIDVHVNITHPMLSYHFITSYFNSLLTQCCCAHARLLGLTTQSINTQNHRAVSLQFATTQFILARHKIDYITRHTHNASVK